MPYKFKLILIIVMIALAWPLWAQDTRYRVEVLVLTHLRNSEPAAEVDEIKDYSSALDFLTPVEATEEEESDGGPEDPVAATEAVPPPAMDPNQVVHMEEMSDVMQEAWRRLRLSAPFRPQQYLSWEQGNQEPFPVLRVHDLEVVQVIDPYANERLNLVEEEFPEEFALPDPIQYYRLDGTVTLRRSRFLHLDLDLQIREGIWETEPLEFTNRDSDIPEPAGPTSFRVHELQQSRQVKTQRMEYFDGPMLSLLAFITAIKVESEEAP